MNENILKVEGLTISYGEDFTLMPLDIDLHQGEILAVVGESGSGKTTLGRAVTKLLDSQVQIAGSVKIKGEEILDKDERILKDRRMKEFAVVFQNQGEILNPKMKLKDQLYEVLIKGYSKKELEGRALELVKLVGLKEEVLEKYPKELSGGMTQKFLIATAIALNPDFIVLDEPTSALDEASKDEFISLIKALNQNFNTAFLLITHDILLAKELSMKFMVLYKGKLVESGDTPSLLQNPRHPYTRGLLNACMDLHLYRDIWGIRVEEERASKGCPFCNRCTQSIGMCKEQIPSLKKGEGERWIACHRGGIITLLEGKSIAKQYSKEKVLEDASLKVYGGEIVSLVGPSGCGKTTLSQILAGFLHKDEGEIYFEEIKADFKALHAMPKGLQIVLQDSEVAMNPHLSLYDVVSEPLRLGSKKIAVINEVKGALKDVGLPYTDEFLKKRVGTLSGGQKQRVNLARALTMEPKVLIADEPTSMLDASTKANLMRLLKGLQNQKGFSMLMVTHDVSCAVKVSDRIYKLKAGKTYEIDTKELLSKELIKQA